jgi:calcineurin-like phosphoesterase family protein
MINLNNIHFTADLYFRNSDAAKAMGFDDVASMESHIIDDWNSTVKLDDTVYILGGFSSIAEGALQSYMNLIYDLNGQKHFILKSGDCIATFERAMSDPNLGIMSVSQYKEIMYGKQKFVLMPYPMLDWSGKGSKSGIRGSVHLHAGSIESDLSQCRVNISYRKNLRIYSMLDIWKMIKDV